MSIQNIHALLSTLSLEQVKSYMHQRGWTEKVDGARLNFTMVNTADGENYAVFLPADSNHGKFRSLLQNMMFSLSVIEGREPFDIATEIGQIVIANPNNEPAVDRVGLDRWIEENIPEGQRQLARSSVKKFLFLIGDATVGNLPTETLIRAAATLACHLAQKIDESSMCATLLFGLIRSLFANVRVDLPSDSDACDAFWSIARSDDIDVPMDTLEWLQRNAKKQ